MRFQNVKAKKYVIFIVVILILMSIFLLNLAKHNKTADYSDKTVKGNISAISTFNFSKVTTIEDQVKALENTSSANTYSGKGELSKSLYQKIFNTSAIIGDSITEGFVDFGFLNEDQVFCKIGASVMKGDSLFSSAAATYPKFAFFSFGMNDMGNYNGNANRFTSKYRALLTSFHKKSPKTKLFVNSISKPSATAMKHNRSIRNYKKFNAALKSMCDQMGIKYIDTTHILSEHPGYYAADGIHVNPPYYKIWMNEMILKAGL